MSIGELVRKYSCWTNLGFTIGPAGRMGSSLIPAFEFLCGLCLCREVLLRMKDTALL